MAKRELMRVEEVARVLGVSAWRTYELCREGKLPCVRLGRSVTVRRSDLETWLARGGTAPREPVTVAS